MSACPHRERGGDHIARLPAVWGDFDISDAGTTKPYTALDGLLQALRDATPPPTVLVASGHGIHAYWPLESPTPALDRVEALNRAVRVRLHADNAIDRSRILRLAGTWNHKQRPALPVRLMEVAR